MDSLLHFIQSIPNSPQGVLAFVNNLLIAHGYLVILFGAALDNFGLPSSGDIVLFAGGLFANRGHLAFPLVMLSGFLGALISDNSVYWIGRIGGRPLIGRILKMRFLHLLVSEKSLAKVERYFETHGGKTVFVGRFGPGLRSMTPLFAGVTAVCAVIDPPAFSGMLLTERVFCARVGMPPVPRFNRTANRCTSTSGSSSVLVVDKHGRGAGGSPVGPIHPGAWKGVLRSSYPLPCIEPIPWRAAGPRSPDPALVTLS